MKSITKARLLVISTGLCTLLTAGTAAAEYHVTAFGKSTGFTELMATDATTAATKLGALNTMRMDFRELNNLCVTEILLKKYDSAKTACATALEKTDLAFDLSYRAGKKAKASILSNLAVAKAKSGDTAGAKSDLEQALSFNSSDANATTNYGLISEMLIASEIAAK